jgi:guanine deaminase
MTQRSAILGDLVDFSAEPALERRDEHGLRYRADHWLLIEGDRIVGAQPQAPGNDFQRFDHRGCLILPGFIDTHVHSAQIDVIGAWGAELLEWLDRYTFPAELRMVDPDHARMISNLFIDSLLENGTTCACVFPTVHSISVEALFEAATNRGMKLIAGKVLMDRNAPAALCDDVLETERICRTLIERWHARGRIAYAVTPRFAPTSTPAQLTMAGRLLAEFEGLYMQTHVAENQAEVQWVKALFPEARSYLDVYEQAGLLGPRSILAHGIWLDDLDRQQLHRFGAQIAHCPSSNLFIGSGLFNWEQAHNQNVAVTLGSDVGGGTSLSMRRTMLDAYKVQAIGGRRVNALALLYAATRGAAKALQLDSEIGSFELGNIADLAIWRPATAKLSQRRQLVCQDKFEALFAWITSGDENDLLETWVAGKQRWKH